MPPARRGRGNHRAFSPYCKGCWLPWCSGSSGDDGNGRDNDDGTCLSSIPDDALSPVLARLPSAADVVRAASTCRRWARIVAKDAAVLSSVSGGLPSRLPGLTLGLFYQQGRSGSRARRRAVVSSDDAAQELPCFVPTAAAARLTGRIMRCPPSDAVAGLDRDLLAHARPVAARNGWLVLELHQQRYTDGVTLCVCNPARSGHMPAALLPPLTGADNPGLDYGCAIYTGHDQDDPPQPLSAFFRLLIVYNSRRGFTALRSYSSDTQRWSTEGRAITKMASHEARELGQSIVLRGVAYWPLRRTALAVRIDTPGTGMPPAEVPMPRTGTRNLPPGWRTLGVDTDGRLIHIEAALGYYSDDDPYLAVRTSRVFCPGDDDDDNDGGHGKWESTAVEMKVPCIRIGDDDDDDDGGGHGKCESTTTVGIMKLPLCMRIMKVPCIRIRQLKVQNMPGGFVEKINLRWFCEKSGNLIFTLGEGTSSPGAYVLNMATEHVEKVADGVHCDSWKYLVGYEMDGAAYLASIVPRRPPLDAVQQLGRYSLRPRKNGFMDLS